MLSQKPVPLCEVDLLAVPPPLKAAGSEMLAIVMRNAAVAIP